MVFKADFIFWFALYIGVGLAGVFGFELFNVFLSGFVSLLLRMESVS